MDKLCPSAPAEAADARTFGLFIDTPNGARTAYLDALVPVTEDVLRQVEPATPNEVLRTAAPCAGHACRHFSGSHCTLVERMVDMLAPVASRAPPCLIRQSCRWWHQEGINACLRCPQIVTASSAPSDAYAAMATPPDAHPPPI